MVSCPWWSYWGAGQFGPQMTKASLADTDAMDATGGADDRAARSKPAAWISRCWRASMIRRGLPLAMLGAL